MPKRQSAMLVFTTVAKKSDATRIASTLVREGLAACVNILPHVESHYAWKGKICTDQEWLLLLKIQEKNYPILEKRLQRIHPYECPEVVGIPVPRIAAPYAAWLFQNSRGGGKK